jgi:hypothetical protein
MMNVMRKRSVKQKENDVKWEKRDETKSEHGDPLCWAIDTKVCKS